MRVKQKVTEVVEKKVAAFLLKDPEYTAKNLKREVEKALREDGKTYKFTERTYNNIKNRILPNITKDNPLDQKWSIGACEKNNIPDDMIPLLMEQMKVFRRFDELKKQLPHLSYAELEALPSEQTEGYFELERPLTVRAARWMARLKPLVDKLIEKYKNDDVVPPPNTEDKEFALHWLLYFVAQLYAKTEIISEYLGHKYFDSNALDELFFMQDHANYVDFFADMQITEFETQFKLRQRGKYAKLMEKSQQESEKGDESNG